MTNLNLQDTFEEAYNPFNANTDFGVLKQNLNEIDERNIRSRFKNTDDPIKLAFDTLENAPLKTLAKDFVKESFTDFISFVTKIYK